MKTFKTLTRERLHKENERISHILSLYNDSCIDCITKDELNKRYKISKLTIGNLPEAIRIVIAKHINLLIDGINESLKYDEFKKLFEKDIDSYLYRVSSLVSDGEKFIAEKNSGYNLDIQRAVLFFGFTREELLKIVSMSRDEAVSYINSVYGTCIPLSSELVEAKNKWSESRDDLERIRNARDLKILGVRNGAYIQTEYPLMYEREVNEYYDKLECDCKKTLKRK